MPKLTPWTQKSLELVRGAYYLLRPLLTVGIRKHLQRIRLRDWKGIPFPSWPVDTIVDRLVSRMLMHVIESAGDCQVPFIWFWPDGANGAAVLTHDVESRAGLDFCEALMDLVKGEALEAFDRSIDVHISRIRAAIEADPKKPRRVVTVRGTGYVFAKAQD